MVQGVGFRPFVYRLASELGLTGFVRNQGSHVLIEAEGSLDAIARFPSALREQMPVLARIDEIQIEDCAPCHDSSFQIISSEVDEGKIISIGADVASCAECLAELFDPRDRRYRYPFLNCTNCGPRLTIITGVPYDRAKTTMASFEMCTACRNEYEDPLNRRFHAEPTACADCGPRLSLRDAAGQVFEGDPLLSAVNALKQGRIVAVKGLGGFHLACLARDDKAVAELRRRKHRDEKPFAIMVADLAAAEASCEVGSDEALLLCDHKRPIVLLRRRDLSLSKQLVSASVAPGNPLLGVMLPYTPLHHLLLADLGGEPLVMTSGNRNDEPIAYEDIDALQRLDGIADFFLMHDRPIHRRCDDSIVRWCAGDQVILRRSRGYVPQPLRLPTDCGVPILAVGGQMKATFALGKEDRAIVSHHCGDLDDYSAFQAYVEAIEHFERFFDIEPELIVHDLHPDYASTHYAIQRCNAAIRELAVQHHHAHLASCLADNGKNETTIGVIFDGTGYGSDGVVWGGEFLIGDCRDFRRAAHFRYVAMPGGEQAVREPWRMAAAHLLDALGNCDLLGDDRPSSTLKIVEMMVHQRLNSPLTSSAGRLFDAVAAIAGVRQTVTYEGQAAVELEWLASRCTPKGHYPYAVEQVVGANDAPLIVDTRPLIAAVVSDVRNRVEPAVIARRFHSTVVEIIIDVCDRLRAATGLNAAALSGGVFMNAIVLQETITRLAEKGFHVYRHREVPPNDGGLSLGQLAIAAARMSSTAQEEQNHVFGDSRKSH